MRVCPNCGHSVDQSYTYCLYCGSKLRTKKSIGAKARTVPAKQTGKTSKTVWLLVAGLVFPSLLCFAIILYESTAKLSSLGGEYIPVLPVSRTLTPTRQPSRTLFPTNTLQVLRTNTPAQQLSCPGAPPQRLEVNEDAIVCTQSDRVIVRSGPGSSYEELFRVRPGTVIWISDGPHCGNNWSWWKVELPNGIVGWMSEGGDGRDRYFLCPN